MILIRGKFYRSQKEAADILGLSQSTVSRAKCNGRLDTVGLGKVGRQGVPITIRGVTYPSMTEAAKALGVSKVLITLMNQRSTLDNVGLKKYKK